MLHVELKDLSSEIRTLKEQGETCIITDEKTPVAEILPLKSKKQGWKRKIEKVILPDVVSAQAYIEEEREKD